MDDKQDFYDLLFEKPYTYIGLRNKFNWLKFRIYETPIEHQNYELIKYEIEQTDLLMRNLCSMKRPLLNQYERPFYKEGGLIGARHRMYLLLKHFESQLARTAEYILKKFNR